MTKAKTFTYWIAIGLPVSVVLGTVIGTPHTLTDLILYQKILFNLILGAAVWGYFFFLTQILDRRLPWDQTSHLKRWGLQIILALPVVILITLLLVIFRNQLFNWPFSLHLFLYTDVPLVSLLSIIILIIYQRRSLSILSQKKIDPKQIKLKVRNTTHLINPNEIAYVFRKNDLNYLTKWNSENLMLDETLTSLIKKLDQDQFFQINRKLIINRKSVSSFRSLPNRNILLTLEPEFTDSATLNKNKFSEFKQWLNN